MNDLISRQAAIEALTEAYEDIDAAFILQKVPSAQQWIPVSERLPEDERQVLCCTQRKTLQKGLVIGYYSSGLERWVCGMNSNVIAWRPLPEVYQEVPF